MIFQSRQVNCMIPVNKNVPAVYLILTYSWFVLFTLLFQHYEIITIGRLLLNNVLMNRSSPLYTYVLSTFLSVLTQASYVQNRLRANGCFIYQQASHSELYPLPTEGSYVLTMVLHEKD